MYRFLSIISLGGSRFWGCHQSQTCPWQPAGCALCLQPLTALLRSALACVVLHGSVLLAWLQVLACLPPTPWVISEEELQRRKDFRQALPHAVLAVPACWGLAPATCRACLPEVLNAPLHMLCLLCLLTPCCAVPAVPAVVGPCRQHRIFSIDPPTARDLDDALSGGPPAL